MFGTLLRTTCRAPGVFGLLAASSGAALWAVHTGPLPGSVLVSRWPVVGAGLVLAAWLVLYASLGVAVLRYAPHAAPKRALLKVGSAMALVVAASLPLALVEDHALLRLRYVEPLYLLAAAILVLGSLFRAELRAAARGLRTRPAAAAVCMTLAATIVAAYAVGAVDALLHLNGLWELKYQLGRSAFIANTALLASLYVAVFVATARWAPAILAGTALHFALGAANVAKMKYMHAAVQPLDLLYVAEFVPQFVATFGVLPTAALVAVVALLAAAFAFAWRRPPARLAWPCRVMLGGAALLVLAAGTLIQRPWLRDAAALAGIEPIAWDSVRSARRNGVLLEFFGYLPDMLVSVPQGYSETAIERILQRRLRAGIATPEGPIARPALAAADAILDAASAAGTIDTRSGTARADGLETVVAPDDTREPVTIVIYMIESLMDPLDLGLTLTADPIPALRRLGAAQSGGYALVPGRFGGSSSSEFEVLTGMSTSFLPDRSVAYKQYLKRRIPSLPCLLAARGYRTVAVQADPIDYFNRIEAYEHLCFERVAWLNEDRTVPRAINDRAPADEAVVDAVLDAIDGERPAFVFAFPSSTHHPYALDLYTDSELDLVDPDHPARQELKYYLNALRVADAAAERLAARVAALQKKVVIAIVGDHLPPLSTEALGAFHARLEHLPDLERRMRERRVPLVVWSNFERERERLELGLNALGPYLLGEAGVEPDDFLRFVDLFREHVPILTRDVIGIGGTSMDPASLPEEHMRWIDDYRLLQHDALFGASYLTRPLESVDLVTAGMPAR